MSDWPSKDHDDPVDLGAPVRPGAPSATPPGSTGGSAPQGDGVQEQADAGQPNELLDGGVVDAADGGATARCTDVDDAGHCTK